MSVFANDTVLARALDEIRDERKKTLRARTAAQSLLLVAEEYLECIGGCDHGVGICACGIKRDCDSARELLGMPVRWFQPDAPEGEREEGR